MNTLGVCLVLWVVAVAYRQRMFPSGGTGIGAVALALCCYLDTGRVFDSQAPFVIVYRGPSRMIYGLIVLAVQLLGLVSLFRLAKGSHYSAVQKILMIYALSTLPSMAVGFDWSIARTALNIFAFALLAKSSEFVVLTAFRLALLGMSGLSLLGAFVLRYEPAWWRTAAGSKRLAGVAGFPLSLGAVGTLGILLLLSGAKRNRWQYLEFLIFGSVLVLSGTRTGWLAIAGSVGLRIIKSPAGRTSTKFLRVGFVTATSVALLVASSTFTRELLALIGRENASGFAVTSDDRWGLWSKLVAIYAKRPVTGFGSGVWSKEFRRMLGPSYAWAGQAHNQVLDGFLSFGIIGGFTMLALLFWLIRTILSRDASHLSSSLALFLFIRMQVESPIRFSVFATDWAVSLAVLCLIQAGTTKRVREEHLKIEHRLPLLGFRE